MALCIRKIWPGLALGAIVAGAVALSTAWVFRVPIYQAPDEPQHLDYALCLNARGRLFRANNLAAVLADPAHANYYGLSYPCYFLHPDTYYLLDRSECAGIIFNPTGRVPPGYGSRAFYAALDRDAPDDRHVHVRTPPSLAFGYPFGYYALLAGWIGLVHRFTHRLTAVFFGARMLSVALLACSLVLTYGTLRGLRLRRSLSLLLTACIGFLPLTSFLSSYVQPDNLSFTLVALCFYLAVRARRGGMGARVVALLGGALGALLVTKQHYYLCVLLPVAGMVGVELLTRPVAWKRRLLAVALLLGPSALTGAVHFWTVRGSAYRTLPAAPHPPGLLWILEGFGKAFHDFYVNTTHLSFWGVFGWLDTPLVIGGPHTAAVIKFVIRAATWVVLALTLVRLERVASRLILLARKGRPRLALRILFSHPPLNSYFLFTVLMFVLHIRTDNYFGAQGRNWAPFLLPAFLTGLVYAPKALTMRRSRALFAGCVGAGLVLYCVTGSYYSLRSIRERYYAPGHNRPMRETPVAAQPIGINQMTWKDGAGDGYGDDPHLVFRLPRPAYVYCIRLRCRLDTPGRSPALFQAFWRDSGRNQFDPAQRNRAYRIPARPEERSLTVWVNDTIDQFRLDPDTKPCHFEIVRMAVCEKP
jgi:hypothetical protein